MTAIRFRPAILCSILVTLSIGCGGEDSQSNATSDVASSKPGDSEHQTSPNGDGISEDPTQSSDRNVRSAEVEIASGETAFPQIVGADIPGAPKLAQPFIVMGSTKPILTEKHGLAAPAVFDWDRDGRKDLLVGEFETGDDESNIRVYFNLGSDEEPQFGDQFVYAKDTEGNVITVPQW